MQIPRSLIRKINQEVGALSGAAQRQAGAALDRVLAEWDGDDVAALRNAVIAVLDALMPTYADMSAARAADFYGSVRSEQGVRGGYRPVADSRREPQATKEAVRAFVESVVRTRETGQLRRQTLQRVDAEVRRAANECIAHNAARDPRRPSYARVPSGDTCGFCLMLASFGFAYASEEAAHHSHANCNCRVVPDFGDASVEGYDPGGMYERYNDCLRTLGGRDGIREEWDALPKDERDKHVMRHGGRAGEAFDAYVGKRMAAEIELRDPEWFTDGKVPEIGFESGSVERHVTDAEMGTAGKLAEHGVRPVFIKDFKEVKVNGRKQRVGLPDLENGIEIKTLGTSGNAHGAVKNYLDSSARKKGLRFVVVDNSSSLHISDDDLKKAASELIARYPSIPGLRLILKDGAFLRIK